MGSGPFFREPVEGFSRGGRSKGMREGTCSETGAEWQRPDCLRCAHYYVTWDPRLPHGCRALGFASRALPSLIVYRYSRLPCQAFQGKSRR